MPRGQCDFVFLWPHFSTLVRMQSDFGFFQIALRSAFGGGAG
jgi:hypothetical protein